MLPDLVAALALSFPIPVADFGCPGYYYDPCEALEFWSGLTPHNAEQIPSDGVLVLQGAYHGGWDDDAIAGVALEVTLADEPVAGALERGPLSGLLVWRPTEAWVPGASYDLSGTVTNADPVAPSCAPAQLSIDSNVVIAAEPAAPPSKPELSGTPVVTVTPFVTLETLACCKGSTPMIVEASECGGSYVNFDPEKCAPIKGIGTLSVDLTGTPAATGAAAKQILYTARINGSPLGATFDPAFNVASQAPFCAVLEALDLASGVITSSESLCFGDAVAEQLGPQDLAVPDTLTCSLQQCERADGTWDPDVCGPVEPDSSTATGTGGEDDGDKGCGCSASDSGASTGPTGLLMLVGLLGLARRRRRPSGRSTSIATGGRRSS
ncbi:MAG: MYXO-CTERM sorting domain-containing protein [Nannocystis sp.]|nr:MYXO-CTERM sorting domain-containing protein [Nannocystis sp.]MBA3549644.1 MYXO-CTERM sorting domain-containing protein [Nannocystis sp.]